MGNRHVEPCASRAQSRQRSVLFDLMQNCASFQVSKRVPTYRLCFLLSIPLPLCRIFAQTQAHALTALLFLCNKNKQPLPTNTHKCNTIHRPPHILHMHRLYSMELRHKKRMPGPYSPTPATQPHQYLQHKSQLTLYHPNS